MANHRGFTPQNQTIESSYFTTSERGLWGILLEYFNAEGKMVVGVGKVRWGT